VQIVPEQIVILQEEIKMYLKKDKSEIQKFTPVAKPNQMLLKRGEKENVMERRRKVRELDKDLSNIGNLRRRMQKLFDDAIKALAGLAELRIEGIRKEQKLIQMLRGQS
jgi:hypothetical protein